MAGLNYDVWYPRMKAIYEKRGIIVHPVNRLVWTARDNKLKQAGFLPAERKWLNLISLNHEAPRLLIADRSALYAKYRQRDMTVKQYSDAVLNDYKTHGWFFKNGDISPFLMLEYYKRIGNIEEEYPDRKRRKVKDYRKASGRQ